MIREFESLREHANSILNINPAQIDNLNKVNIDRLFEEILVHKVELEIQNFDLIENQIQLQESNNKYAELYDSAPLAYFTIDKKGLIIEVNKIGAEILGVEKDTLINRSFSRYLCPASQCIYSNYFILAFKDAPQPSCDVKLLKRNGSLFHAKLEGKVVKSVNNNKKLLMMITDVAFQPKIEKNEMNEIISQITNEINHPLGVITNYIHGCIRKLENKSNDIDKIIDVMKTSSKQLNRISEIILRMKNFHLKGKLEYQPTCLDSLILESISYINQELHDFFPKINYTVNKNFSKVHLDKLHIQHVIINLMRNAIEAMRDANTIEPRLNIQVNFHSKKYFEVCFIDNGPGFKKENIHKIFTAHYTTKTYGMGLGLALSRTVVEAHGGALLAELNPTYGACFKFILPLTAG